MEENVLKTILENVSDSSNTLKFYFITRKAKENLKIYIEAAKNPGIDL